MYPKVTLTKVLGKTPFVYQFCHTLGISEVIDAELTSDEQKKVECSIGEIVTALIVNRLTSPTPLYRVQEWARDSGFELLFPCAAEYLNDDRLGRTLDLLYPHLEAIQEAIVLKAVTQFNINPEFIHYDITSVYFQGEYDEVDWVTYGYSRDQKPDLVQCNLGLNVTDAETFPALWTVLPGNTNDTSTVITNMENLKK